MTLKEPASNREGLLFTRRVIIAALAVGVEGLCLWAVQTLRKAGRERSGTGTGRVYTITIEAKDYAGSRNAES